MNAIKKVTADPLVAFSDNGLIEATKEMIPRARIVPKTKPTLMINPRP